MLRILVIALLLVNAALLGLQLLDPGGEEEPAVSETVTNEVDAPTLTLLSEMSDVDETPSGSAECFTVGPYESLDERDLARRLVAGSAVAITQRQTAATVDRGTWVYLPVQPDYVTARSMALTLQDAGFTDARVVRDGEWNNSVSLGYFLSDQNSSRIRDEARSLGFPVETRRQENVEPRYWIDYEQRAGAPYVAATPDGIITPDLHRYIPCGDQI